MENEDRTARLVARVTVVALLALSAVAAAFLPPPKPESLVAWTELAVTIAGVLLTVAAIWLGMLFGVAYQRAGRGTRGGASELMNQLLRPLRVGGATFLWAIALIVARPYLELVPGIHGVGWLARGVVFGHLVVLVGAVYGLVLSLAPVEHVIHLLRIREAEADSLPAERQVELVESAPREPWRG